VVSQHDEGRWLVARLGGLGKSLAALVAALPPGARPPSQVDRTPSAAEIDARVNALAEEVRQLGAQIEKLLRERRDAGETTTKSLLGSPLRWHRALLRVMRDRMACCRLTSVLRGTHSPSIR
jgi:hypothetical protein